MNGELSPGVNQVRRGASIIGASKLAIFGLNFALLPVLQWMAGRYEAETAAGQIAEMAQYLLIFFVPCWIVWRLCGFSTKALIGSGRPTKRVYMMTIGLVMGWEVIANYLAVLLGEWMTWFGVQEVPNDYMMPDHITALALQIISMAVLPPIVEELCFRGFYVRVMEPAAGTGWAIGLSAVIFWISHYSIQILPLALGFGLIGGYVRERYQSLLPGMCAHALVNAIYVLINYSGARWGTQVQSVIYFPLFFVQVGLGIYGLVLFLDGGDWRELRQGRFGTKTAIPGSQLLYGILTSLPMLVALAASAYFLGRDLRLL